MNTPLKANKRTVTGRKVKFLRKEGYLPANVYGKKTESFSIQVNLKDFEKVYKETGETGLIDLSVDGKTHPVLVHNIQRNPVSDIYIHADFFEVNLKEKVKANIPLELIGVSPAEKLGAGTVVNLLDEVEVEALPGDLPEKFELDISVLDEVDKMLLVKDISVDSNKVEILTDLEIPVAKVDALREEEEEPVVEEASESPASETTTESDTKEGEETKSEE